MSGPSPISRDGFIFVNNQFYVDVDGNFHKREDAATLYVLLNAIPPTKDGKAIRKPANSDREAHYYSAQLIHYGLPPLKTRDPAKKKLLAAYGGPNGRTLNVPPHILTLEAEMSKEWRDLETKLVKKEAAALSKKRKAEAAGMNVDSPSEPAKKGKPAPVPTKAAVAPTKAPVVAKAPPPPKAPAPAKAPVPTKPPVIGKTTSPTKAPAPPKTPAKIKSKTQIRKDISTLPEDFARKLLTKLLNDVPEVEDILATELVKWEIKTLKEEKAAATAAASTSTAVPQKSSASATPAPVGLIKAETMGGIATAIKTKAPKVSAKAPKAEKFEDTLPNSIPLDSTKWSGPYVVLAPKLGDNWDSASGPLSLELYPSSTASHIWGKFDFGIISGVMRSRNAVPGASNTPIPFEWRGREDGENVMTFGSYNNGVMTFTSEGGISATMQGDLCGEFTFSGNLRNAPRKVGTQMRQTVKKWKSEFRNIHHRNFDIEGTNRWGGWGGEPREEKPFESDTTVGDKRHDEADEDFDFEGYY